MITLCIRYTIDQNQYREFDDYARAWPGIIRRCGGELIGYFLPTKLAGSTNTALALIDFENLDTYEKYRTALAGDSEAMSNVAKIEKAGCILNEDRSFLRRAP
jgi:NIPSNAP